MYFGEHRAEGPARSSRRAQEERFVVHDVPRRVYVLLRDSLDTEGKHLRLTPLGGELELRSPSPEHRESKSIIGRLLETWCIDHDVELFARGACLSKP